MDKSMNTVLRHFTLSAAVALGLVATTLAVGWRLNGNGIYPDPLQVTEWSAEADSDSKSNNNGKNIVWKTKLPSWSNSSPIFVGEQVFATAEPTTLVCLEAGSGEIRWQDTIGYDAVLDADTWAKAQEDLKQAAVLRQEADKFRQERDAAATELQKKPDDKRLKKKIERLEQQYAELEKKFTPLEEYRTPERAAGNSTATPAADGKHVYVTYGTGVAACYDLEGRRQWARLVEKPALDWGHTASPLLVDGKVLVHFRNLIALDPRSGEIVWRCETPARYGTPVVIRLGDVDLAITGAGEAVRVSDGAVLAKEVAQTLNSCSPISHGNVVYFIQQQAQAVKFSLSSDGALSAEKVWETKLTDDEYFASPLYHDGLVYAASSKRTLTVVDAASGEEVYEQKLRFGRAGDVLSSLALAGDRLYVTNDPGYTVIVAAGRTYRKLGEGSLENVRSCPIFAGERMYVRCMENLYCVGQ